ncbi:MAG: ABC transporter ATP-binding protein [Verrucomicrobiota bacterium]|jgi:iron complex transport system ATP-binding protein|nr:ABC transporter ATP-binding protein [Verrucomicrobiota bacterium]
MPESPIRSLELTLRSIRFAYAEGTWAMDVPSLSLGGDSLCAVVGPNGSGKSTLLKIAVGLLPPQEGRVIWNGVPVGGISRRLLARSLGFLPQESAPLFDYTVEQVAALGRHAYGAGLEATAPEDRAAVDCALDAVELTALRRRRLSHLSGGERRRAWIASALAQEPSLLLLDEPTLALDLHQAASVMQVLSARSASKTRMVVVLHDLNLAALFCPRVILMQNGRIEADDVPSRIFTRERLKAVYGSGVEVFLHPRTQRPVVQPAI